MIQRSITPKLVSLAKQFPAIVLTGPRQSGKTTLAKMAFPKYAYVSLENLDNRDFATRDPRGFLAEYQKRVIIDEAQRAPDLLSYIQTVVDEDASPGRYILTGSQQFNLLAGISQSLAGRAAYLRLLPFSVSELAGSKPVDAFALSTPDHRPPPKGLALETVLFQGLYPRIYDRKLAARDFLAAYIAAYIERDVREVTRVGDLSTFRRFLQLCAGRSGQILNLSNLGADCGISHPTARQWLSVLEASSIVVLLQPFHKNFNKRIVKSPKLYFLDSGLMCHLLRLRDADDLRGHPLYGSIFETFVMSEVHKAFAHLGESPPLYYWRDRTGHEIDLIVESGRSLTAVEIKSAKTVSSDFFKQLRYFAGLKGVSGDSVLVYGGEESTKREGVRIRTWHQAS
ncbi:MAG: ATP-binding protein [Elusimicrobiota bacterium]